MRDSTAERRDLEANPDGAGASGWLRAGVAFGAALLAAHLYIAVRMPAPIMHGDEASYLLHAPKMLDGSPGTGIGFRVGYSFFLVPAHVVTGSVEAYYRAALVTNALLATSVFPLLYLLLRRLSPTASRSEALAAAALTTLLPAFLVGPALVLSGAVLVPGFVATALLVARAAEDDRLSRWVAAAALAGYLSWVNPRGLVVVPALLLACAVSSRPGQRRWVPLAVSAVVLTAGALSGRWFSAYVTGRTSAPGERGGVTGPLARWFDAEAVGPVLGKLLGSTLYLVAATAGIGLVGLVVAVAWALGAGRAREPRAATATFVAVPVLATLLLQAPRLGSWYELTGELRRFDILIYGRYVENFLAPVLAVGFVVLLAREPRGFARWFRGRAWLMVPPAALALGFGAERVRAPLREDASYPAQNGLSFVPYDELLDARSLPVLGVAAAVVTICVLAAPTVHRATGAVLAAAFLTFGSFHAFTGYVLPEARAAAEQRELVAAIREHAPSVDDACVSLDSSSGSYWHRRNYTLYLLGHPWEEVDLAQGDDLCGNLVITGHPDVDARYPGAVEIGRERGQALWLVPS